MDLERAFVLWSRWVVAGAAPALVLLVAAPEVSTASVLIHLSLLVAYGIAVAVSLAPVADDRPFAAFAMADRWRWFSGAAVIVVLATGATALASLATSAAARYQPSLQFLQLLSAVDIAWAGAALYLGVRWWKNRRTALVAAAVLGVFCVWSLWNYLTFVGLASDGGWLVDGPAMMQRIIPYDMAAAIVALAALWVGAGNKAAKLPVG